MSIYEIIENNNIHSDRYAMAAISCIFKAFGDPIRSKEFWPWGDKVQCPWTITKGTEKDIDDAEDYDYQYDDYLDEDYDDTYEEDY